MTPPRARPKLRAMEQAPAPQAASPETAPLDERPGFWLRGGAYMIDNFLASVLGGAAGAVAGIVSAPLGALVDIAAVVAYFTIVPVVWKGTTVGKKFAGLEIVTRDGEPLTHGAAFLRWVGYMLSLFTLGLGFLMAAFTQESRALEDFVAGTRVVRRRDVSLWRKIFLVAAGVSLPAMALLGILAAVAIPNLQRAQALAKDSQTRAALQYLRTGVELYRSEQGAYPRTPAEAGAPDGKGLEPLQVGGHARTSDVELYGAEACSGSTVAGQELVAARLRDTGRWGYVSDPKAPCYGRVFIDCTHASARGPAWYAY